MITNIKSNHDDLMGYFNLKSKFLGFEQCRLEVIEHNFKNIKDYQKNRKNCWPSCPHLIYKNEWRNWYHFLGKEKLSFKELRAEVIKHEFKSIREYQNNKKSHWLANPASFYKSEWKGWDYFLGKKKQKTLTFYECRKKVVACRFKGVIEYHENRKKYNFPSTPHKIYKKQWKGWRHFLGNEKKSFKELRNEVIEHNFKSMKQYKISSRKYGWPSCPDQAYKNEWKGSHHFLGKEEIVLLSFEECRKEVIKYEFKSGKQYREYRKQKPNWPWWPPTTYKDKWKGWVNFLGL